MTGFRVRFQDSDGKWRSVEIESLTDEELNAWALSLEGIHAKHWLVLMIRWIRENAKEITINPGQETICDGVDF